MKRRAFMTAAAAAAVVSPILPSALHADTGIAYTPGLVEAELAAGKTVFLDFSARWCSTCARQERIIKALQEENPAYLAAISFIRVDWDDHRRGALVQRLRIPRRSTLVVLKGGAELGRLVADTRPERIRGLMDTALKAAS